MTTQRQVKALLRPIIAERDDLVPWPHGFLLKPIRHVTRAVWLTPTSTADRFNLEISAIHTFLPNSYLFGVALQRISTSWMRNLSDPDIQRKLAAFFDETLLPLLRPVVTLNRLRELAREGDFFDLRGAMAHPCHQVHIDSALGRFDAALETCEMLSRHPRRTWVWVEAEYAHVMDDLRPLLEANDRAGVAALLRRWEVENIERLGLQAIYEPTLFPLELQTT